MYKYIYILITDFFFPPSSVRSVSGHNFIQCENSTAYVTWAKPVWICKFLQVTL